jgi:flagellar hook protein FlgE
MMRSLYAGITGLRGHQTRMDVIGNNIANVNTVAYKSSRVVFQDIYSQTIKASSAPSANNGGTNPQQIGLGTSVATIDVLHNTNGSRYTGNPLDLSIEGGGYFVLSDMGGMNFTRAGNFYTNQNDMLVTANGSFVQGYVVDGDGALVLDADDNPQVANVYIDPNYYNVSIDSKGTVVGLDALTNAKTVLGQLVLATFSNENALEKVGANMYQSTVNSGNAVFNTPGNGTAGKLNPGALEMSNVDLASEFTDMIVTQRGFQANSRIITTTDAMLEELVNIKR